MAAIIGALRGLLSLDSAAFETGAKRSKAAMGDLERRMVRMGAKIEGVGRRMTLGLTLPMAGLAAVAVKSSLKVIDAQAKMAQSLGTTVVSMQVLDRAADLSGVSIGEVEQATIQLTKRLSQAAGGTGVAAKALVKLHLSAVNLQKLPLDKRLAAIQQAMKNYVPEAERAAVASDLFGSRAGLIFSRIDGSALRIATDDVNRFGVAISEVDADQIEIANDAISRLGLAGRGAANQFTVALAPSLQLVADKTADAAEWFSNLSDGTKQTMSAGLALTATLGPVAIGLGLILKMAVPLGSAMLGLGASVVLLPFKFAAAARSAIALEVALGATSTRAAMASISIKTLSGRLTLLRKALIRTGIGVVVVGLGELVYRMNLFGDTAVASSEAQGRLNAALNAYAQTDGPAARAEVVASAKAYIEETRAKLASAQADLDVARAKQIAAKALLDQNPHTKNDSGYGAAMAANIEAAQLAVDLLNGQLTRTLSRLGDLAGPVDDTSSGLNESTVSAGNLASGLGVAAGQAATLAGHLKSLPGALTGAEANIAGLRASILTLAGGGDAATASVAKYRAELEATYGVAKIAHYETRQVAQDAINTQVKNFEITQRLTKENQGLITSLIKIEKAGGGAGKTLTDEFTEAEKAAKSLADSLESNLGGAVDGAIDWMVDGFDGGMKSLMNIFKTSLARIIAIATANPIKLSLGIGGIAGGAGTSAVAGGTGSDVLGGGGGLGNVAGGLLGSDGLLGGLIGNLGSTTGFLGGAGNVINGIFGSGGSLMGGVNGFVGSLAGATGSLAGFTGALGALATVALPIAAIAGILIKGFSREYAGTKITGTLGVDGFDGGQFDKYKGGWFRGDKTVERQMSAEIQSLLDTSIGAVRGSIVEMAGVLNLGAGAINGFVGDEFTLWISRMDEAEITAALNSEIEDVSNSMADLILGTEDYTRSGETSLTTLARLSTSLNAANDGMDLLGDTLFDVSLVGADAASRLVDAFGSVENMTAAVGTYWSAFYTAEERAETTLRRITKQFSDLGVAMPQSRAGFRAMVEGIDATTEAGAVLYAQLLNMSGALNEVLPQVAQFTMSMTGLLSQIGGEIGSMIDTATGLWSDSKAAASLWYKTATTLRDFLGDLLNTDLSTASRSQTNAVNRNRFNTAFEMARGGDVEAARNIPELAKAYLESARAGATSSLEYRKIAAKITSQVNFLAGISELEGANKDVLTTLYETQIDVLTNLANFLQLEGLTGDQIEYLDQGIQNMIGDWSETTKAFETSLTGLEKAIKDAEAFSYDDLAGNLDVFVTMAANGPKWLGDMVAQSADGIRVALDFIVRSKLSAPDRWLAVNSLSEHAKTIDFILGVDISKSAKAIALATTSELRRNISFIVSKNLSPELQTIALAGNSEFSRVVNVALDKIKSDEDALKIALSNIGNYAVGITMAFGPGIGEDVRRIALTQAGSYATMLEATVNGLNGDERRILLSQQGSYAANIVGVLVKNMPNDIRRILLEANTAGVRAVTIAALFPGAMTQEEHDLLAENGTWALRTIRLAVNPAGISPIGLKALNQLSMGDGKINRNIASEFWRPNHSYWDMAVLDQLSMGQGTVQRNIASEFWRPNHSYWDMAVLTQLGKGTGKIFRNIRSEFWRPSFDELDGQVLGQLVKGTGSINRIINGRVNTSSLNDAQRALLASISGSTVGQITLGGTFKFSPEEAFSTWFDVSAIDTPMVKLGDTLDDLRAAVAADTLLRKDQATLLAAQQTGQNFLAAFNERKATASSAVDSFNSMMAASGVSMTGSDYSIGADGGIVNGTGYFDAASGANFDTLIDMLVSAGATEAGTLGETVKNYFRDKYPSIGAGERALYALRKQLTDMGGIPSFAAGGFHKGGVRIVGEQGWEIENANPSRIHSHSESVAMLDNRPVVKALDAVVLQLARLERSQIILQQRQELHVKKTADILEQWDSDDLPKERVE